MRIEMIQELTGRYMKISVEQEKGKFGANMLKYNEVKGILGAEVHYVDDKPNYIYEVRDMISVTEFFEKKRFHSENLECFVEQLIQILNRAGDYFLDERNLVLMSDDMFYDETEHQVNVAYLDGFCGDVAGQISKLFEVFMNHMDHRDRELVFLVYGLHKISKDNHFTLNQLDAFIQENRQKRNRISVSDIKECDEKPAGKPPVHLPQKSFPEDNKNIEQKVSAYNKNWKKVLYLVAGIFIFLLVLKTGLLNKPVSGELDLLKAVILGFGITAAEGYLFQKERKEKDIPFVSQADVDDSTTVLVSPYMDQTVVLEETEPRTVFMNLIPEDWHREELKIRKSPFFIGKDAERADGILADAEISRVHAKIVMEEHELVIIDQESTNGTFINGKRAVPWERCVLKEGDRIGISSVCYRVEFSHL